MRILAFDTSLGACSAAVLDRQGDDVDVRAQRSEPMPRGHAERIVPMIEVVMREAGCRYDALDAIAVTRGPGTFTGIRIAVSTARALALAAHKPILATTSLALLAATARRHLPADARALPVLAATDARKGECYVALFEASNSHALLDAAVLSPAAAVAAMTRALGSRRAVVVGSGAADIHAAAAVAGLDLVLGPIDIEPDAVAMTAAGPTPCASLTPLYLRPADAVPPASPAIARSP